MAEALAVVGIVANIIQVVDFGSRVLKRLEEYQSKLGEIPEAFRHIKAELPVLLDALQQTKAAIDTGSLRDETKNALLPAVKGCGLQIKTLDNVIAEVLPASDDSWTRRSKKAFQSLRHDAKVKKITGVVRGYIQTLTYHAATSSSLLKDPLADQTQPRPAPSSTVPFRRDPHFIDRKILTEIKCKSQQSASRAALVGLGGVGKSQIAIEYAYQVRDESPTTWVFWVHAGTQARFEEGYRRIAETTRMAGWDNPKADILRLVRNWLCDESNGRWVMIVDNADDSGVFFSPLDRTQVIGAGKPGQAAESLLEFLPQSLNGSILITSRSRDVAYRLTGSHPYIMEVKPMDEGDALALLQKKLSFDADEHNAIKLLQALDYMPLAITQAAAYIEQRAPRMTISRYLDEIYRSDHDRARLLKKDIGDSRRDGRASNSIIATWQISFEHIRKNIPTAARLLSLMSLFDRQGIPESLLHNQYQRDEDKGADFEEDIHTLTSYSLVEMNEDGDEFEMHRLVQFSTKKWLELYGELDGWKGKYVTLMDNSYPVGRHKNWKACQALFPHAQAAVACRPTNGGALGAWASVLFKAAWYASEMGNYHTAKEMGRGALEAREAILGTEHLDTLSSINNLGLVLESQGKYEEAEAMHWRALGGYKKVLGPEHPYTLTSISNLGSVLSSQGKYEEAEAMHQQVLEIREKVLGPEHPDTLSSVSHLGSVLESQGKYKEAEAMHWRDLKGSEKVLGPEHPDTLSSVSHLGSVLESQGKYEEAEVMHRQVLETREKVLGLEHPRTLSSISNLGLVLSSQGKYEEAEAMHRQVLKTKEKVLGLEHPDTLSSVSHLSSVLSSQGKYKEAEAMHRRDLKGSKKVLGPEHPDTLSSASHLGSVLLSQGKYKEAEAMHQQVLEIREKVLGPEHPHTLSSISNLGSVLESQGKYKEAEAIYRQVLETRGKVLGPEHPRTLSSISKLGLVLLSQGKYKEAEAMHRLALGGYKKVLGLEHPHTLTSVSNLGLVLESQGKYKEAESMHRRALGGYKKVLGPEHPYTLTSVSNLGSVLLSQGKYGPARAATARPRTLNRPSTSNRPSIPNRPPTSQNQPASKRPSSTKRTSASSGRTRPKSSYRGQLTIYEDEDNNITQGIIVLCTLIDQHAERFYAAQYSPYVRRTIGEALVNHIMVGGSNVSSVLSDLAGMLESYASNPADDRREDHMERMCTSADRIQRMVQKHPSDWSFGRFNQGVWFPSVCRDGNVIKDPDYD